MDISIVTVSYNAVDTIEQTIQSVESLKRHYGAVEYVIVDGGSTDGTIPLIQSYEGVVDDWVSEPDEGIYDAMNKGINRTQGEWVGIINSDDWYSEDALGHLKSTISASPKANIVIGQLVLVADATRYARVVDPPSLPYRCLKSNNHPSTFVHRDVYEAVGGFDLAYPLAADIDFLMRAQSHADVHIARCMHPLAYMRMGGASYGFTGMVESGQIEAKHFGVWSGLRVGVIKSIRKARRWAAHRLLPDPIFDRLRKVKWKLESGGDHVVESNFDLPNQSRE